ncbi:hypothetical protein LSH36_240g00014 [Paralvinella palmiformis]|uniref:Probable glycerol kinase n=1 Tax=Paralvinella palmiformis TaxID=53620 RepID=A0AAD9N358_9ANNE|nr:hypothetical protein LSH36_240g00014 [Paralvinella palmiformis]
MPKVDTSAVSGHNAIVAHTGMQTSPSKAVGYAFEMATMLADSKSMLQSFAPFLDAESASGTAQLPKVLGYIVGTYTALAAMDKWLVGAVDQGTSSTRFILFESNTAKMVTHHQKEISQIFPQEGWVEQDPVEILHSVTECIDETMKKLSALNLKPEMVKAIGITNQRETTIVWDKVTGKPLHNAIIWLDARTSETVEKLVKKTPNRDKDSLRDKCGLPLSTYFSAVKMRWLLDNVDEVRQSVEKGHCLFGNVDTWLLWNLTGGLHGGKHYTDVTNASRTMLMNIHTLEWDDELCKFFDIPKAILPEIRCSSEIYGYLMETCLRGLPISGILGDQQAALVGQSCFKIGQVKNTYGTGCFLLNNTGNKPVESKHGLLTTVAYKLGKEKPTFYALEGSVAIAGAAVQWLRDNLGIIEKSADIETLAADVDDTHGCYFVPAFSGLFCPYWQPDARGVICGLSQFTTKQHLARACLEAVCFQTCEVLDAMKKDSGLPIVSLQVDGGMTVNSLLMQLQADLVGIPVVRPAMAETTALGAAMAAGMAEGVAVWHIDEDPPSAQGAYMFQPRTNPEERAKRLSRWKKAVERTMHWELTDLLE